MDEITTEVRLQQWSSAIAECNNSGMTKKEWCRQNGYIESMRYMDGSVPERNGDDEDDGDDGFE